MDSKTALFNRAKEFIYSPKLEDLHIFSKEYLNSVLTPYYSSNNETDNYASICIDYNKLNDINNIHGYETGDKVMHYSLSLMQSVLPQDCTCARIAGDEFIFIIDNCDPERIDYYTTLIDEILKEHEKELLFCSVTSYGVHSSEKESLSEMIAEADVKITEQKNNFNHISSHSRWGVLEKKLLQNLTSFFKSLRLYKQTITIDFLNSLYTHTISSCSDLLEHDFSKIQPTFTKTHVNSSFNSDELEKLNLIFSKENSSLTEIESIDESTYNLFLNSLIRDPYSGAFSKGYFERYLLTDCNQEYNVKYISSAFVKLYNTIFSHNATDIKLNEMTDGLTNYLEENENITFCDDSFLSSPQNYFISLGAGDYLIALPKEKEIDNNSINEYLSSNIKNNCNLEDVLQLFYSQDFHSISKENCDTLLNTLSNECKTSKDAYKLSTLDTDAVKDALNNIICDAAEYYLNNIPLSNTITSKHRFLNLIAKTMLDVSVSLNHSHIANTKNDDIEDKEGR